ncbi:hypothetical protein GCM10010123_33150 [Pilimelia anulata]|uniref:Uncharacterized protein n=1 Tax=Pilimelia anulata TaxID=53371 RepID=A0A8J3B7T0_9ACTN|nr:hypothetical protein [Pilimelia anulata]GGK00617.1 hypothetical protein GCM10010123_33150 [Pilimelia anulata]
MAERAFPARWRTVAVIAGGLFAVNLVARLVVRLWYADDGLAADAVTLSMLAAVGLACLGLAAWWSRYRPVGAWAADLALASGGALLLAVLVGPFASGAGPFTYGAGEFFKQIWQWGGVSIVGALIGLGAVTALGLDARSRGLRRYAEAKRAEARLPRS